MDINDKKLIMGKQFLLRRNNSTIFKELKSYIQKLQKDKLSKQKWKKLEEKESQY